MTPLLAESPVELQRRPISASDAMCEAYYYAKPSAFSRGMEVRLPGARMIFVSGTASVGPDGQSLHVGDFRRQTRQVFANAAQVLRSAGADWRDVVKTTIFLKHMSRDYAAFNEERIAFFRDARVAPFPASTCVEAGICRDELLVEMELIAIVAAR